jgi:hypothetical protein
MRGPKVETNCTPPAWHSRPKRLESFGLDSHFGAISVEWAEVVPSVHSLFGTVALEDLIFQVP